MVSVNVIEADAVLLNRFDEPGHRGAAPLFPALMRGAARLVKRAPPLVSPQILHSMLAPPATSLRHISPFSTLWQVNRRQVTATVGLHVIGHPPSRRAAGFCCRTSAAVPNSGSGRRSRRTT